MSIEIALAPYKS